MKVYMFPGQGSQSKGMGGDLFDEFSELTEKADKILGYSIKELCLEDPRRELNKTQFTQPALYVANALHYLKKTTELQEKPDFVLGHSLGEFNALLAAECFDFEAGLKLVKKRGELMGQTDNGAMAAILNASKEEVEVSLQKHNLKNIDLANYNTPLQIVISGLIDEIAKAQEIFQGGEVLYYPLNTSGAFHSRFMKTAQEKFKIYFKKFKLSPLQIPVVSNVTAKPYVDQEIFDTLTDQIVSMVRWSESIEYLIRTAAEVKQEIEFVEIGQGDVLSKMITKIREQTSKTAAETSNSQQKKLESPTREYSHAGESIPDFNAMAKSKVEMWNARYPVGTKVKSTILDYNELETRTEAVVLFGHRAAVYMQGFNGYFDLDEVIPHTEAETT